MKLTDISTLIISAVVILAVLFAIKVPGILLIDEAIYTQMVYSYSEGHKFELWNGETEAASVELETYEPVITRSRFYSKYPPLYVYLAVPFYRLFGIDGLFYLNMVSLVISIFLTLNLARIVFNDRRSSLITGLLLISSTYAVEYGIGIWPHALSLALVLLAVNLQASFFNNDHDDRASLVILSGLVSGIAVGVRMFNAVYFIVLAAGWFFLSKKRVKVLAFFGAGAIIPLMIYASINRTRFGIFFPFVYTKNFTFYTRYFNFISIAVLTIVLVILLLSWHKIIDRIQGRKILDPLLITLPVLFLIIFLFHNSLFRYIKNLYSFVVDLSRSPGIDLPDQPRSHLTNALVYTGAVKKALFQSCPYMVCAVLVSLSAFKSSGENKWKMFILTSNFLAAPLFLALFNFHGGLGWNMRYFIESLPFGVILTLIYIKKLPASNAGIIFAIASAIIFFEVRYIIGYTGRGYELYVLYFPLVLIVLFVLTVLVPGKAGRVSFILVVLMFVYASFSTFDDIRASRSLRKKNLETFKILDKHISRDALLFLYWGNKDPAAMLKPGRKLRVADVHLDEGRSINNLIEIYLKNDKIDIYFWADGWEDIFRERIISKYKLDNVCYKPIELYRLNR